MTYVYVMPDFGKGGSQYPFLKYNATSGRWSTREDKQDVEFNDRFQIDVKISH